MGKRSDFERIERDFYETPESAVLPLIPHLPSSPFVFAEPCAGGGALIDHIEYLTNWLCSLAIDISPQRSDIGEGDMFDLTHEMLSGHDLVISNPPWTREILHPFIEMFSERRPLWVLLDSNWANTRQAAPYMDYCHKVVATGRHKWIPGTKMAGKDDASWYLFNQTFDASTVFYAREPRQK